MNLLNKLNLFMTRKSRLAFGLLLDITLFTILTVYVILPWADIL